MISSKAKRIIKAMATICGDRWIYSRADKNLILVGDMKGEQISFRHVVRYETLNHKDHLEMLASLEANHREEMEFHSLHDHKEHKFKRVSDYRGQND